MIYLFNQPTLKQLKQRTMEEGKFCAGQSEKQPTGILKELLELKTYYINVDGKEVQSKIGNWVEWSDVEAIINKYSHP